MKTLVVICGLIGLFGIVGTPDYVADVERENETLRARVASLEGARCAKDAPSNGSKSFEACDDSELCQILAASFRGEAVEWRRMPNGEVKCLAFIELGTDTPARCDKTQDMFGG